MYIAICLLAIFSVGFSVAYNNYLEVLPVCDQPYGAILHKYDMVKYNGRVLTCVLVCLQSPRCKSVLVNHVTRTCYLNRNKQLAWPPCSNPNASYVTVPSKSTIKTSCTDNSDCKDPESECRGIICQCVPGLVFDVAKSRCVQDCPQGYGDTFQALDNYVIWGYADKTFEGLTQGQCMQACIDETSFTCRHAEYWVNYEECYISDVSVRTAEQANPGSFRVDAEYNLYLRDCF